MGVPSDERLFESRPGRDQRESMDLSRTLSSLAATLMDVPASIANKRLAARLTPLAATLTENTGEGVQLWLTKR